MILLEAHVIFSVHNMMSINNVSRLAPEIMFRFRDVYLFFCTVRSIVYYFERTSTDIFNQILMRSTRVRVWRYGSSSNNFIEPLAQGNVNCSSTLGISTPFSLNLLTLTSEAALFFWDFLLHLPKADLLSSRPPRSRHIRWKYLWSLFELNWWSLFLSLVEIEK